MDSDEAEVILIMNETHNANAVRSFKVSSRLRLPLDELIETLAARLLHTLKAELDVDRQRLLVLVVVLQDIEPAKDRPLVVGRASPNELTILLVHNQGERISVPAIGFQCLSNND